ncbi:MAG: SOS response-associated peptidase [Desulfobacterales bacterium]|nr:SOS response-associated peptidase [Desulfobacterales bacterium]
MCGRFVGFRRLEELRRYFPIDAAACEAAENYNVAPSQQVLAIARLDGRNVLGQYHWGLVPFWAKDKAIGAKLINARSETVAGKPSFREAFKRRRCLILADGFYEWQGQKGKKQPLFITLPDKAPFAFAGLWEVWRDREKPDEPYHSCTIITREAVGVMQEIHHRMPVILAPGAYEPWLDPENRDAKALTVILGEQALVDLVYCPVSRQVNAAHQNQQTNIACLSGSIDGEAFTGSG